MSYLFVYGTLMKKCRSNEWARHLHQNARYIAEAYTWGKLYLIEAYPGLIKGKNKIWGELYYFEEDEILQFLDEYENFDLANPATSLYVREKIKCFTLDQSFEAYTYLYNQGVEGKIEIENGKFLDI